MKITAPQDKDIYEYSMRFAIINKRSKCSHGNCIQPSAVDFSFRKQLIIPIVDRNNLMCKDCGKVI